MNLVPKIYGLPYTTDSDDAVSTDELSENALELKKMKEEWIKLPNFTRDFVKDIQKKAKEG